MALFVLLPAPTGTGVVAPGFRPAVGDRLIVRAGPVGARELQILHVLFVLLLDIAGHILHGALGGQALLLFELARDFQLALLLGVFVFFVLGIFVGKRQRA